MRFKALIIFCIIYQLTLSLIAQNKSDRYHEFGSEKRWRLNGYIGPLVAISNVEDNFSIDLGATGGFIINKNFFAGLYWQNLVTKVPRIDLATIGFPTFTEGEVKMIHVGGVLGYIHSPEKEIHWGVSSSEGVGILSLYAKDPVSLVSEIIYDDKIYIIIPKFYLELNMTKWFKVNVSAGYRFVGKVSSTYINQDQDVIPIFNKSDYTKPEFSVSLLFGAFGFRSAVLD